MLERFLTRLLPKNVSPTTHGLGVLQAKSYRVLKAKTAEYLKQYDITTVDWAVLGALSEASEGMSLSVLSEYLGVKSPLMTRRTMLLLKMQLIKRVVSKDDSRSRVISLTPKGKGLIPVIERGLRTHIRPLFAECSARDLLSFVKVMAHIAQHSGLETQMDED